MRSRTELIKKATSYIYFERVYSGFVFVSVTAVESSELIAGTSFKIIKIPVPGINDFYAAPVAGTLDTALEIISAPLKGSGELPQHGLSYRYTDFVYC